MKPKKAKVNKIGTKFDSASHEVEKYNSQKISWSWIYTYLYEVIVGDGEREDGGVVGDEGDCGQEY